MFTPRLPLKFQRLTLALVSFGINDASRNGLPFIDCRKFLKRIFTLCIAYLCNLWCRYRKSNWCCIFFGVCKEHFKLWAGERFVLEYVRLITVKSHSSSAKILSFPSDWGLVVYHYLYFFWVCTLPSEEKVTTKPYSYAQTAECKDSVIPFLIFDINKHKILTWQFMVAVLQDFLHV